MFFLAFNALNTAESIIIQELLHNDLAKIYWDIDDSFICAQHHDAALFIKTHKFNWKYYKTNSFKLITQYYKTEKNISVVGVPKNIGQAKYIGELLLKLERKNKVLNNAAVVLGDENLLIPVLSSIPKDIWCYKHYYGLSLKSDSASVFI